MLTCGLLMSDPALNSYGIKCASNVAYCDIPTIPIIQQSLSHGTF